MWFILSRCQDSMLQKLLWEGDRFSTPITTKSPVLIILVESANKMAIWPFLIYLSIYGALELQIKRGQIRWKANISSYNFYGRCFQNFIVLRPEYPLERV